MGMKFLSGIRNCHLHGVDSLVLRDRISPHQGMVRVFYNRESVDMEKLKQSNGLYTLAPHNHRQDITLYRMAGAPVNINFDVDRRSHDHYHIEMKFGSAIKDDKLGTDYRDCVDLYLKDARIVPTHGLFLPWQNVHTMLSKPGDAWLVVEGTTAPEGPTLLYSPTKNGLLEFDQQGLYQTMTQDELEVCEIKLDKALQPFRHLF